MKLLFFHGLESGPHGGKYRALKARFPEIVSPDFRGMREVEERLAHAVEVTEGEEGLILVGSSFGGLVAGLLAHLHPERVAGYVLCAPALHWEEAETIERVPSRALLIHGVEDPVVPVEASRAFAKAHSFPLIEVDDNHRLSGSRALIVSSAAHLMEDIATSEK